MVVANYPNCPLPRPNHDGGGLIGPLYYSVGIEKPYPYGCRSCLTHYKRLIGAPIAWPSPPEPTNGSYGSK